MFLMAEMGRSPERRIKYGWKDEYIFIKEKSVRKTSRRLFQKVLQKNTGIVI